jgi:hypothetical protein
MAGFHDPPEQDRNRRAVPTGPSPHRSLSRHRFLKWTGRLSITTAPGQGQEDAVGSSRATVMNSPKDILTSHLLTRSRPMLAEAEITPTRRDYRIPQTEPAQSLNLVAVAGGSPPRGYDAVGGRPAQAVSFKLTAFGSESRRIQYTRIAARTVGLSAAWLIRVVAYFQSVTREGSLVVHQS